MGVREVVNWKAVAVAAALIIPIAPVAAQMGVEGPNFVQALRDRDSPKAAGLLEANPLLANARDGKGDTPLLITVGQRNEQWVAHLLKMKADPNMGGRNGDTPLIVAARIGADIAAELLIASGAKVDLANRMGETALIAAVQQRQLPLVKLLLAAGANPDKTDSAAGYSARDYAKRDTRNPQMLRLIEAAKKPAG
jgi:uncharacterized protein